MSAFEQTVAKTSGAVLLECVDVALRRGHREVVSGVNLELRAGETAALLGPNGAGKSTLLEGLAGELPLSAGQVRRYGRLTLGLQLPALAQRTVLTNLTLALGWWGVPRSERRRRAITALTQMNADHLADRRATELSGGERRRVHLARSIAVDSDILLLDEPFAGLDGEARTALLEEASSALRSEKRATLVVVHDRDEAWALADRLLIILDGRLAADGSPAELLEHPPSPAVAKFLGYDGELHENGRLLLTRPADIQMDPDGPLVGTVTRAIHSQNGVRVQVQLEHGRVQIFAPNPGPSPGQTVRLVVQGGVEFHDLAA